MLIPGYIKLIFMVGIMGLSLVAGMYFLMLLRILRMLRIGRRKFANRILQDPVVGNTVLQTLAIIIPLQFLLNFKNLYFLTRSSYELTLMLFFIAVSNIRYSNRAKKVRI